MYLHFLPPETLLTVRTSVGELFLFVLQSGTLRSLTGDPSSLVMMMVVVVLLLVLLLLLLVVVVVSQPLSFRGI